MAEVGAEGVGKRGRFKRLGGLMTGFNWHRELSASGNRTTTPNARDDWSETTIGWDDLDSFGFIGPIVGVIAFMIIFVTIMACCARKRKRKVRHQHDSAHDMDKFIYQQL